jgi:arginyl-tRNA synthetase
MSARDVHEELYGLTGLGRSLARTLAEVVPEVGDLPAAELTIPPKPEFGDVATAVALTVAKRAGSKPRDLAAALGERWCSGPGAGLCTRYDVAGPGFLNLFLSDEWYRETARRMVALGADHGRGVLPPASRRRVNIEFVSVNPTGPLHVGHARYASMGDALCRLFAYAGHDVTREFYVNDFGTQMVKFGQSLAARYGQRLGLDLPVPDDGYLGDYVLEAADRLIDDVGERYRAPLAAAAPDVTRAPDAVIDEIKAWGRDRILDRFRATLERLRVPFDVWKSEASLYDGGMPHRGFGGEVGQALRELDADGELFDADGAVWLRTTDYGDDKDRVLVRQTGAPTYFLSDIAYHRDKMDRGFEHLIDIWGADHHGYVPRMKAMFTALPPHDPDRLELIIGQLVNLLESGAARRMSKRRGDIVTVDDLIDAIGVDAVRFFMVGRSHDSTLDLDLDLAVEQSNKNPVYYVQYAHARICSVLRNLADRAALPADVLGHLTGEHDAAAPPSFGDVAVGAYERNLVRALARFPLVVLEAVERRGPHRLHAYLGELAAEFHVFYRNCRVIGDDPDTTAFRTGLCVASRTTLAKGLELLGVSAPQSM